MRVFRVRARHLEQPQRWRLAHVVAEDPGEAVLLLKKSVHFWDYAMPPEELVEIGAGEAAIGRAPGAETPSEKGVFPVASAEPSS